MAALAEMTDHQRMMVHQEEAEEATDDSIEDDELPTWAQRSSYVDDPLGKD